MKLRSINLLVLALAIVNAPVRAASLVGQSISLSGVGSGAVTITSGANQGPTTVITPGAEFNFCIGPNADDCATSGLRGTVNIEANTITFSFVGSTNNLTGDFFITLSGFTTPIGSVSNPFGHLGAAFFGLGGFDETFIVFDGSALNQAFGGGTFTFTIGLKPVITTNPAPQTVCESGPVTFTAAASGSPDPTVQWEESTNAGTSYHNLSGETSPTLTFSAGASQNGNLYRAVFTNASGAATTTAAMLTVNTAPNVTTNPVSQPIISGQSVTFTAAAGGSPAPTVQWQVSTNGGGTFTDIPGKITTTLTFVTSLSDNGNQYRAVFTNDCSVVSTTAAILSVGTVPIVNGQPSDQTVCAGSDATFSVSATGTPTPSVRWEESTDGGATYHSFPAGGTTTTMTLTSVTATMNGNRYRAVFNNGFGGDVTSNSALLTVNTSPHITLNPANQAVQAGQTATFTVAASGTPTITVQWQVSTNGGANFSNISGATSNTLSFVVALSDADNQYRAVFTNLCSTTSTAAALLAANQGSYLVRYASNLTAGDSVIDITNSGANGNNLFGPGYGTPAGNICVNVYAFSPDEQLVSCCSCLVTPNGLVHMTANNDLVSNTLTGIRPSSIVIKMVATSTAVDSKNAPFAGSSCANSAALAGTAAFPLADGAHAWGTTLHTDVDPPAAGSVFSITETPFLPASLDAGELASIANRCTNIIGNGSSFGVCRSCRLGGLGGAKQ